MGANVRRPPRLRHPEQPEDVRTGSARRAHLERTPRRQTGIDAGCYRQDEPVG